MNAASLFQCAVSSLTVLTLQAAISALVTKATSETALNARVNVRSTVSHRSISIAAMFFVDLTCTLRLLTVVAAQTPLQAFIASRLDYCNSVQ